MSPAALNLRHLRALAAVIRLRSFSAAAKAVGITQPAVTQAMGKLDALLGTALLDRSDGVVEGTDAGILLSARAEAADAALATAFRPQRKGGIGARSGAQADVTMAQLTALLGVADHGSYAAGASALGLAQPTLHRAVAELERLVDLVLVERRGRGVGLTGAGERLAAAARLALAELQAGLDELAVLAGRDQGKIRIGAHGAAIARLLPQAIARFLAEHPPVMIEVQEVEGEAAADRLREGRLDALLVLDGPALEHQAVVRTPIGEEPLVVAARTGHALLEGQAPGLLRLAQAGWAVPPVGQDERNAWDKLFLDGGLYPPTPSATCPSLPALAEIAARSDLLTIAPRNAIADSGGRLSALGAPLAAHRRLVLATRAGWAPTPAQATFLEEIRAIAASGSILSF
jgi:DNA-binding transcriptional LysR family regulator